MSAIAIVIAAGCGRSERTAAPAGSGSAGAGSGSSTSAEPVAAPATTPNQFLARGTPTFIVGTAGTDRDDRAIAAQATLIRDLAFPTAAIIADTEVDPAAWPANPVVYGGPHVNSLLASLAPCLPFELSAGHLAIGDQRLDRDDLVLVTVVPARAADATCRGSPELLLYAGTGTPGVAEINSPTVTRGAEPLVVADGIGRLIGGTWRDGAAVLEPPAPRPAWTEQPGEVAGVAVMHAFPGAADADAVAAIDRGIAAVVKRLALPGTGLAITVYVHADRDAKQAATGNPGDGHAVPYARALHVIGNIPPASLESLVAHEATHVLVAQAWGPTGSPLLGEGLAVWTSGQYAGRTLAQWRDALHEAPVPDVATLLGRGFRQRPEHEVYPAAGLFVGVIQATRGLAAVRTLYGAGPSGWEAACRTAGTTPAALQAAFAAELAR